MKKHYKLTLKVLIVCLIFSLAMVSCAKDSAQTETPNEAPPSTESEIVLQQTSDEANIEYAIDNADQGLDELLNTSTLRAAAQNNKFCDATIDSTSIAKKQIIINFNGSNCLNNGVIRTGSIIVNLTIGNKWSDVGATLTLTFQNFSITRNSKTIVLNGTKIYTNVTGGRLSEVITSGKTIKHTVVSNNMKCKFGNGTERAWNISREKTFEKSGNYYTTSIRGKGSFNNYADVATWGTNRLGKEFLTRIENPVIWSSECTNGPKSGIKVHVVANKKITIIYGVDEQGNLTTTPCPTHYKIVWTKADGSTVISVIPY